MISGWLSRSAFGVGILALTLSAGAAFVAGAASAQDPAASFPNKPIRMVVGFAAGGGNDIFARLIQNELSKRTGWTVIIENKAGAGGRLSAEYVAREPADGYTILVGAKRCDGDRPADLQDRLSDAEEFHSGDDDRRFSALPRGRRAIIRPRIAERPCRVDQGE